MKGTAPLKAPTRVFYMLKGHIMLFCKHHQVLKKKISGARNRRKQGKGREIVPAQPIFILSKECVGDGEEMKNVLQSFQCQLSRYI